MHPSRHDSPHGPRHARHGPGAPGLPARAAACCPPWSGPRPATPPGPPACAPTPRSCWASCTTTTAARTSWSGRACASGSPWSRSLVDRMEAPARGRRGGLRAGRRGARRVGRRPRPRRGAGRAGSSSCGRPGRAPRRGGAQHPAARGRHLQRAGVGRARAARHGRREAVAPAGHARADPRGRRRRRAARLPGPPPAARARWRSGLSGAASTPSETAALRLPVQRRALRLGRRAPGACGCCRACSGRTRARSRNSATPSSCDCSSSSCTRLSTSTSRASTKPCRAKKPVSKVRQNTRRTPRSTARRSSRSSSSEPTPRPCSGGVDGDGAHLGEVGPQHVQRRAPDDGAADLRDDELLHVLVERDGGLAEQPALGGEAVDQVADGGDVVGARPAHGHVGGPVGVHGQTLGSAR